MKSEIRNMNYAKQVVDFTSLKDEHMMPTDIDGCIEFSDKLFIFMEFKHKKNITMSVGQRVAYERICDRIQKSGAECFVLLCEHDTNLNIVAGECMVTWYRYKKKWRDAKAPISLGKLIKQLKEKYL